MLNNVVLVGRIKEFIKVDNNCQIKISVTRSFKNENGEYEADLIPIMCFGQIAQNIAEYCKEEDVIGIRGRIQQNEDKTIIIGERISFLSSNRKAE